MLTPDQINIIMWLGLAGVVITSGMLGVEIYKFILKWRGKKNENN